MSEVKLKYRPEDYPDMADELIRCEKALNEYLNTPDGKDKIFKRIRLKDAVWYVRLCIKNMHVTKEITQEQADEMVEYFWGLIYD